MKHLRVIFHVSFSCIKTRKIFVLLFFLFESKNGRNRRKYASFFVYVNWTFSQVYTSIKSYISYIMPSSFDTDEIFFICTSACSSFFGTSPTSKIYSFYDWKVSFVYSFGECNRYTRFTVIAEVVNHYEIRGLFYCKRYHAFEIFFGQPHKHVLNANAEAYWELDKLAPFVAEYVSTIESILLFGCVGTDLREKASSFH